MILTTEQIEHAWQLLGDDGAALADLRQSWNRLTKLRRELDVTIVALAELIDELRLTEKPPAKKSGRSKAKGATR